MEKIEQLNIKTKSMEIGGNEGEVTIAVNGIGVLDYQNDISMSGSFDKTLKENFKNIRHYLNHNTEQLIGCPIEGKEENGSLVFKSALCLDTEIGRDTYALYKLYHKHGNTLQHSIGCTPVKRDVNDKRKVLEWKLFEFSTLTKIGACPGTHLIDIKSADFMKDPKQALEMLKDARHFRLSDKLAKEYDLTAEMLEKALAGKLRMVQCDCGMSFDYDTLHEYSLEEDVKDEYRDWLRWMAGDIVRDELNNRKDELREEVLGLIQTKKSLLDVEKYVRCPRCGRRIYSSDIMVFNVSSVEPKPQTGTSENGAAKSTSLFSVADILVQ
jgi:HK97 family phage prohead protease